MPGDSRTSWGLAAATRSQVTLPLAAGVCGWMAGRERRPGLWAGCAEASEPCAMVGARVSLGLCPSVSLGLGCHLHQGPGCVLRAASPPGRVTDLCHFWVNFLVQRSTAGLQGHESVRVFCERLRERERVMPKILGGVGAADSLSD